MYFLTERGYHPRQPLPKGEIIRFCVELAEENRRLAEGEQLELLSITEIADWLRKLVVER